MTAAASCAAAPVLSVMDCLAPRLIPGRASKWNAWDRGCLHAFLRLRMPVPSAPSYTKSCAEFWQGPTPATIRARPRRLPSPTFACTAGVCWPAVPACGDDHLSPKGAQEQQNERSAWACANLPGTVRITARWSTLAKWRADAGWAFTSPLALLSCGNRADCRSRDMLPD
jgi:hypothetical protein